MRINILINKTNTNNMPSRLRRLHVHCGRNRCVSEIQLMSHPMIEHRVEGRRSSTICRCSSHLGRRCQFFSPSVTGLSFHVNYTQRIHFSTNSFSTDSRRVRNNGAPGVGITDTLAPGGLHRHSDFFGEAITFVKNLDSNYIVQGVQSQQNQSIDQRNSIVLSRSQSTSPSLDSNITDAISSFDGMALCILSKGSANLHTGNDAAGPDAKSFHSSAIAWSEILQHAREWNMNSTEQFPSITTSPMLVVAAVAPVVAQGGNHYLRRIDKLLSVTTRESANVPPPSMWTMANYAVSFRDATIVSNPNKSCSAHSDTNSESLIHHLLTPRERWHMHAMHQLLQNNHRAAMGAYLRLLELFPGDLLGLSLALDVAYALGDSNAALRAATNVSTYWRERDGGPLRLKHSHPAQNLATSLISVGLSSSSRTSTAERLAELAIARDSDGAGGVSVWALTHCLASEGRSSEMVSKLAGFDGTQFYEASGYLHFSSRMKGYGATALLDRSGAGADRSALRLYDGGFGNVLEYSGNNVKGMERGGEDVSLREMRVPTNIKEDVAGALGSMITGWFRGGDKIQKESDDEGTITQRKQRPKTRTVEDVLCWLPPSPVLLTHATALLFRLTLCGAISESDDRWADARVAWTLALKSDDASETQCTLEFMPLAMVASSLVIHPDELLNEVSQPLHSILQGLHKMGHLMKLGKYKTMQVSPQQFDSSEVEDWREVLTQLASARDGCQRWDTPTGMSSPIYHPPYADSSSISSRPIGWDFDLRQFLEYALCHAAMKVGDYESLCLARAVISEGTTLRPNCPELWLRYGVVLDMLGDEVGAENARAASISLGSGEGSASF